MENLEDKITWRIYQDNCDKEFLRKIKSLERIADRLLGPDGKPYPKIRMGFVK